MAASRRMQERLVGLAVIAAVVAHAASYGWAGIDQMLWLCHVASATLAIGLVAGAPRLVASGWLLHVAWGFAVWLWDAVSTGVTTPTSIAVHVVPLAAGAWWFAHHRWPRGVAVPAWAGFFALVPLSRFVTRRAHDVNSTFHVWPPLRGLAPGGLIGFWIVSGALCLASFVVADWALRRWDRTRRAPAP